MSQDRAICDACARGNHQHSRYTDTGADAGCPNAVPAERSFDARCYCSFKVPTQPPPRCPTCGHFPYLPDRQGQR